MQGNEQIYFRESKDGDTFIERDNQADGFVCAVWVNGSRVGQLVLDTDTTDAYLTKC